jgi:hypothetical protein
MPKPTRGETKNEFIRRFISSAEAKKDFPKLEQRVAVAHAIWRRHVRG